MSMKGAKGCNFRAFVESGHRVLGYNSGKRPRTEMDSSWKQGQGAAGAAFDLNKTRILFRTK